MRSRACVRCATTRREEVSGLFRRLVQARSCQEMTALRLASEVTSRTLWGSSMTRRSPPSPVVAPPTEVATRTPRREFSKRIFSFWSRAREKTCA